VRSPCSFLASFSVGILCSYLYACFEPQKNGASQVYTIIVEGGIIGLLLILLAAALAEYTLIGFLPSYWPGLQLLLGGLLLLITLSNQRFVITKLLEFYPIRFFGMISYGFYLYHDFILWNIYNRLSPLLGNSPFNTNISKSVLAFILTTWGAWASYEFVEKRLTTHLVNIWGKVRL
jgi:peptidoglycan/LPS O-acetylase OafA/YrhL